MQLHEALIAVQLQVRIRGETAVLTCALLRINTQVFTWDLATSQSAGNNWLLPAAISSAPACVPGTSNQYSHQSTCNMQYIPMITTIA
jgi:hypothetical protein